MLAITWYLLKVILCSGILLCYYWLALRNKVFHQYNRFYLLCVIVLSITLPFVQINFGQSQSQASTSINIIETVALPNTLASDFVDNAITTPQTFNWSVVYLLLYTIIIITLLVSLFIMLLKIRTLLKRYSKQQLSNITFVNTDNEKGTPFSFLKYIFWNSQIDMTTTQGHQIFKHEVAHISQKHTYDKLLINVVCAIFWCNPFYWLLRKELNMIHEFIADKYAIEDGNVNDFAAMLLHTVYPQHQFAIANNFFYSPIKRRLTMLTKIKNPKVNYLGRVLALPLLVVILAAFTFKVNKPSNHLYNGKKVTVVIEAGHGGDKDPGAIGFGGITEKELNLELAKFIKKYNTNESIVINLIREEDVYISPVEKAKMVNDKNADLFVSLHIDSDKKLNAKSGLSIFVAKNQFPNSAKSKVFASSIINEFASNYQLPVTPTPMQRPVGIWVLQNVNAPSVLIEAGVITNEKDVTYLQSKEGKEAIAKNILLGIEKYLTQPQTTTIDTIPKNLPTEAQWEKAEDIALQNKPTASITSQNNKVDFFGDKNNVALYVVDGVITNKDGMEKISPNSIEKIDILKGESATKIYGDKGRNGVIVVTTKSTFSTESKPHVAIGLDKMNVLYIGLENPITVAVSGYKTEDLIVTMKNGSIEGRNGKYIATVSNINPAEIVIETIENGKRKLLGSQTYRVKRMPDPINGKNLSDFDIKISSKLGTDGLDKNTIPDMLYIVNGLQTTKQEVAKINTDDIIDVRILNAKDAIPTYGEKASKGAMIFNVKQHNTITADIIELDKNEKIGAAPYVEVDGKPYTYKVSTLPKEKLKNVKIIGKNKAMELYGEKAKDGAILVSTK